MTSKQIAAFAVGPLGAAFLGIVSLPVITWLFSQEDVGRMAMLQVTISFCILIFSLGLDQSYVREFHEAENQPALLKHAMLPGLVLLVMFILILLSFGGTLSEWLFGVSQSNLSALVALALVASYISRFLSLVLRMNERGLAYSMSQLLPKLLLLVIIGSYVALGVDKDLTSLVFANTIAIAFVCLIYAWNTSAEWLSGIHSKLDIDQLKSMLRFGLPLILGGLAFWGLTAIDKVFLRVLTTFEELAIYSVSVSFATAASILQSVFSTVWAPMVYKWASAGEGLENVRKVNRYILALVVLGFALAGLLSWIVTLFLPANYAAVQWIVISCLGYPLLYTLSETTVVGIGISRRSSFSMLAALSAFAVNLLGNWWLIPIFGAAGAAVSTCLSFWVFFFLRTEFSIYLWKPMPRVLLYAFSLLSVIGASVSTLWGSVIQTWMTWYWLIILGCWAVAFKDEVGGVLAFFSRKNRAAPRS